MEEATTHQITTMAGLQEVVIGTYVCPSRRQARTGWSEGFRGIIAFIDYAGVVPCTYTTPARTVRYDPTRGVPLTVASLQSLATSYLGGTARTGGEPQDNTLYDGVIVRTPWRWQRTDAATGKQIGVVPRNVTGLVKHADITDGASKTIMIAEKYIRNDNYDGSFSGVNRNSDDRGWSDGFDADIMRSSCFSPINDGDPIGFQPGTLGTNYFADYFTGSVAGLWNVIHFGSAHTTGINAVLADGAVRHDQLRHRSSGVQRARFAQRRRDFAGRRVLAKTHDGADRRDDQGPLSKDGRLTSVRVRPVRPIRGGPQGFAS